MLENTAGSGVLEHALSALSAVFCVMAPVPGGAPTTTTNYHIAIHKGSLKGSLKGFLKGARKSIVRGGSPPRPFSSEKNKFSSRNIDH